MCGRYLTPDQAELERHWAVTSPPDYFQSYNVAPSQSSPVIGVDAQGASEARMMTWGFKPSWAKRGWINARSETAFTSSAFGRAARRHRCLVPAMGWYEWQGEKPPKQPYVFHLDGFVPFAFAGIWTAGETSGSRLQSFAILTRDATDDLKAIHNRMPVVLTSDHYGVWMAADTDARVAEGLLTASSADIRAYRVSNYVNKPANNDPRCIEPVS